VLKAGIKVENVRVGKLTNFDKLVLDLATDGTISPEDAFNEAVKILIEQFGSLEIGKDETVKAAVKSAEEEGDQEEKEENKLPVIEEEPAEKKKRGRPKKV